MIFFTDIRTDISNYCLLHINKYHDPRKSTKKLCFVDPGIHYLMKHDDYPYLDELHQLAAGSLLENEYISIDYPGDMFPQRMDEFIDMTYQNNLKYQDQPRYISTVQFHLSNVGGPITLKYNTYWGGHAKGDLADLDSFRYEFDRVFPLVKGKKRVLGIGNLCRILYPNELTDRIFDYIIQQHKGASLFHNEKNIWWVHIYGMAMRLIKKYVPLLEYAGMRVSTDSTKWTRVNGDLRAKYFDNAPDQCRLIDEEKDRPGIACTSETRDEFFETYIKIIQRSIKTVIY